MGGEAVDDIPPPGSRGGADDIAAPVMNVEDVGEDFVEFVRRTDPEGAAKLQKTDDEIKAAIEALFEVSVTKVNVVNIRGKTKRTVRGMGKRNDTRKAYVTLADGQEISFAAGE